MKQYLAIAVAGLLIVVAGWREWTWTGFLGGVSESEAEQAFAQRLEKVPMTIGEWDGEDLPKMDPRERATAGISGELSRSYKNRRTGDVVSVFIVSGKSRNVNQHTPDQCYVAAGFTMANSPERYPIEVGSETVEFMTTAFKKEQASGSQLLRIFWTWSSDGKWESPKLGRFAMARRPALYKMYLTTDEFRSGRSVEKTPSLALIRDFLPELNAVLFPSSTSSSESPSGESAE